jgi:hypothetical protein
MIDFVHGICVISAFVGLLFVLAFNLKSGITIITAALVFTIGTSIIESQKMKIENFEVKPTAIDVYRGKTTLEITYRDSVAVDSVVVYKMK